MGRSVDEGGIVQGPVGSPAGKHARCWNCHEAGFGVALGLVFDNLALGSAIGVAIGTAIGASLSERNRTGARTELAPRGASLPLLVGLALLLFLVVAGMVLLLIFGAG
jgi:hypothetical protein